MITDCRSTGCYTLAAMDDATALRLDGSEVRRAVGVTALYLILTVFLAWPFSIHPGSRVLSAGTDTDLYIWTLAWDTHAFTHHPLTIFDANIFYPHRYTLAYSENLIGSAFIAAPILWTTGNPVLAMNVVALLSCVLCGVGAYVLGRRVGLGPPAAALTGLIFAFAPPRFFRLEQIHLTTIEWVPFGLAYLHGYFDEGRRRDLRLAAAFFTLQALTSGHGAVFLALAMLGLVASRLVLGEPLALARRLRDLGIAGALILVPAALIFLPYRAAQAELPSLKRSLIDWGISTSSFFASPSHFQTWVLSFAPDWMTRDPDAYLFPGYLPLLLGACAFAWRGVRQPPGRGRVVAFYGLLTLVCFWLMLGPPLGLWQFVYWLPGVNFIRVPSRFSLLGVLGLAVLAGCGFERICRRVAPARVGVAAIVLGALFIAESATIPLASAPYDARIPAIDRWLDGRPKPFSIAEVPLPDSLDTVIEHRRLTLYMRHSMAHWQKTVHGYSGAEPADYRPLYWQLTRFPDETSLHALTALGITYVVVHADLVPPSEREEFESRFVRWRDRLVLEHVEGDGRVYSLRGR
jgi:hypothetical protein